MTWQTFAKTVFVPLAAGFLFNEFNALLNNWGTFVSLLGPHFAWLGTPAIVAVLVSIAHQMKPTVGRTPLK